MSLHRSRALASYLAAALLACLCLVPSSASAVTSRVAAVPTPARAMWVWDRPGAATLVSFATRHGVQEMFVHVPDRPDLPWLTNVSRRARSAGISLQALGSETTWIDNPAAALAWRDAAWQTGLFDSIHFDVEPWLHPDWNNGDRTALVGRYLTLLDLMADHPSRLEADVSFWLHEITTPSGGRLDQAVLSRVDAITVMTYRDTATGPDSISGLGATALAAARAVGKPARFAVETNYLGDTAVDQKQTFWGQRRTAMSKVLATVDAVVGTNASYAGIAIHDRAGFAAMVN